MEVGLGIMNIPRDEFWSLTVREWIAKEAGHREGVTGKRKQRFTAEDVASMRESMKAHEDV